MIASLCLIAEEPGYTQEQVEQMKKKLEIHEKEINNVSYRIKGVVVDENNVPLNDVQLEIMKSRSSWTWQTDRKTEKKTISKEFEIKESGYIAIVLYFFKEGYYAENISFTQNSPAKDKEFTSTFKDGVLTANDVRVVMRAKGIRANMDNICKKLSYNENGSGDVINLGTQEIQKIKDISDIKTLPENCIYIYAERTADGKIDVIKPKSKVGNPNVDNDVYPRKITLKFSDPEGGFIVFPNKNGRAFQYMKEAPEIGYPNELIFNVEYGEDIPQYVYFYFKSKGKYGKGYFIQIMDKLYDNRKKVENISVELELRLNTDGSRNVNGN